MKHQQFNVHSTPCCLALVVQTNQEASGWVETQEKVNTPPPPLPLPSPSSEVDSSVFRPLLESVLSRWLLDDWKIVYVNGLRTIYFQFEYEEQGKRRLLGWSRHNLKMCRSKDNACFGKNQQRKPFFTPPGLISLFNLKQTSSQKILKTVEFNLSTSQNMGRFRKWLVTGSFTG